MSECELSKWVSVFKLPCEH